jgi:flagellar motor switch protein FliN/FliY
MTRFFEGAATLATSVPGPTLHAVFQAAHAVMPALAERFEAFWELPATLVSLAVTSQPLALWRHEAAYVSELALKPASATAATASAWDDNAKGAALVRTASPTVQLRLSSPLCAHLLEASLGPSPDAGGPAAPFHMNRLSRLEGNIFKEFSRHLFAAMLRSGFLRRKLPMQATGHRRVHLLWAVRFASSSALPAPTDGYVILSCPPDALRTRSPAGPVSDSVAAAPARFSDGYFADVHVPATLHVGDTRLRLAALAQLAIDDVVVLEQSDLTRMALSEAGAVATDPAPPERHRLHWFQVTLPASFRLERTFASALAEPEDAPSPHLHSPSQPLSEEPPPMSHQWDDLQIDVSAEFVPVPMPLRELKRMMEGLLIEVGPLVGNRIRLHVEGKTVGYGDLVIVGDQFAVRVTELIMDPAADHGVQAPMAALPGAASLASGAEATLVPPAASQDTLQALLDEDFEKELFGETL